MPTTPTSVHPSSARFPPSTSSSSSPMTKAAPHNGLDAAQINRITRVPGSTLTFASFDPGAASGDRLFAFRKLSLNEELCRPKRVVVETGPDGKSTWRFVPKARMEEGVDNEGSWPRGVDICGKQMTLSHDQWDAYKLDPDYDCVIKQTPQLTLITRSSSKKSFGALPDLLNLTDAGPSSQRKPGNIKRHLFSTKQANKSRFPRLNVDPESEFSESDAPADSDNVADEAEVKRMVGGFKSGPKPRSNRLKVVHEKHQEARRFRREQTARRREEAMMGVEEETPNKDDDDDSGIPYVVDEDEVMMSASELPHSPLRPSTNHSIRRARTVDPSFEKRKVRTADVLSDDDEASDTENRRRFRTFEFNGEAKRVRTVSPSRVLKVIKQKRYARGQKRLEEQRKRLRNRAEAKEAALLNDIMGDFPDIDLPSNGAHASTQESSTATEPDLHVPDTEMDDDALREAAIEESRRKLAELEADKPLWEEQARRRAAQENEGKRLAEEKREAQLKAADERKKAKERQVEEERRKAAEAAFDLRSRRERARKQAQKEISSWKHAPWTTARALERYRILCAAFDGANFIRGEAVTIFENIPWPMLSRPGTFSVEDIDWASVEAFFSHVRQLMPSKDFRDLVEKSHKRFHPDRWRSRRVLTNVDDEEEKECLEVAANTVAQALTPLWQELTGR